MDPYTTSSIIRGVGSVARWASNWYSNRGGFQDTALAKRLEEIKRRGVVTKNMRSKAISGTAKSTGEIAARTRTGVRGRLIHGNMEGSIAGVRAVKDVGTAQVDAVGATARELDLINAQSKIDAENQFRQEQKAFDRNKKEASRANNAQLIQDIYGIGTDYYKGKAQQERQNQLLSLERDKLNLAQNTQFTKDNLAFEENDRRKQELALKLKKFESIKDALRIKYENEGNLAAQRADTERAREADLIARSKGQGYYKPKTTGSTDSGTLKEIDRMIKTIELYGGKVNRFGEIVGGNPEMVKLYQPKLKSLWRKQLGEYEPQFQFNDDNDPLGWR